MDADGRCRSRHVAIVGTQRRNDELFLELAAGLVESETLIDKFVDEFAQLPVESPLPGHGGLILPSRLSLAAPRVPSARTTPAHQGSRPLKLARPYRVTRSPTRMVYRELRIRATDVDGPTRRIANSPNTTGGSPSWLRRQIR